MSRAKSALNAFSALCGNGSPTWNRSPAGITPAARSLANTSYDAIASSIRGHVSHRTSVTPGLIPNTGVSYACRGIPVGEAVSTRVTTPSFGRMSFPRSYDTQPDRGPVSPSGSANTRPSYRPAAARSALSVDSVGRLPTRSSSLFTRLAIEVSPFPLIPNGSRRLPLVQLPPPRDRGSAVRWRLTRVGTFRHPGSGA
jgi:hypothetical protein